jgi:hypothetical protein
MYDFKDEEKYEGSVNGQPRNLQVQQVLLKTIALGHRSEKGCEWSTLVSAVKAKFEIKNWLTEVRSQLQQLHDNGHIYRDSSDIHVEAYRLTKSAASFLLK